MEYLVAAIEHRFLESTKQTRTLIEGGNATSFAAAVASLARDIYMLRHNFVIILDDWNLVDEVSEISEAISHLLLRCPNCHLILAARSYPSLPNIMLLAARREMSSFDEHQLRFTTEEVDAVLQGYDAALPLDQVAALTERLNGWISGVLLLYQAPRELASSPVALGMSAERQIYHFLVEQVFNQQPSGVRSFLLDSALLEELTPAACDAIFQRNDSRQLLEMLLRRHLFISEIRPGVLRYHTLFREFLREHYYAIDQERHAWMTAQIADFYVAQGQWILAFEQYITAGRHDMARKVIAFQRRPPVCHRPDRDSLSTGFMCFRPTGSPTRPCSASRRGCVCSAARATRPNSWPRRPSYACSPATRWLLCFCRPILHGSRAATSRRWSLRSAC